MKGNKVRKLISICICAIVLLLVSLITTATAGNSTTTKPASIVPQDLQTAINKAVEDPVLSAGFLCDVWGDLFVQKYLQAYPTLTVKFVEGGVTFRARDKEGMPRLPIQIQLPTDGVILDVGVSVETRQIDCAESLCRDSAEFISAVKQSAFWAAVKSSIVAQGPSASVRTARK